MNSGEIAFADQEGLQPFKVLYGRIRLSHIAEGG
jgi:hypothetical protein